VEAALELFLGAPERPRELRKLRASEQHEYDRENDQEVGTNDLANHHESFPWRCPRRLDPFGSLRAAVRFSVVNRFRQADVKVVRVSTYFKMLTARAMTSANVITEIADCESMVSLAHLVMGITSVGLNAVAFVNETYR